MPNITYYVASSIDGYVAPPDGSSEWLSSYDAAGENHGYAEFYATVDAMLVGRRTYEQCLAYPGWPDPDKPCWVFSKQPLKPRTASVTVTAESPQQVVSMLQARNVRRAWLVGGGQLAGSFRAAGLITDYIVTIIPVILGAGIALFDAPGPLENLRLQDSKKFPGGLVQLRYGR